MAAAHRVCGAQSKLGLFFPWCEGGPAVVFQLLGMVLRWWLAVAWLAGRWWWRLPACVPLLGKVGSGAQRLRAAAGVARRVAGAAYLRA